MGLKFAIMNHGILRICFMRGDLDFGKSLFSSMARAWKALFTRPEASVRVSAELRATVAELRVH